MRNFDVQEYVDKQTAGEYREMLTDEPEYRRVVCRYCRMPNFHWKMSMKGWRMYDSFGAVHICSMSEKTRRRSRGGAS